MTIVVTGATGYIGSHLVRAMTSQGIKVLALTRGTGSDPASPVVWVSSDLSVQDLAAKFEAESVVGVVHLASLFLKDHREEDLGRLVESNIHFGIRVLEAATKAGCRWFVNTGTFWQHFHHHEYRPANLYAATKQAFEDLAEYYWRASPIRFVTLKLNDTYGPGDPRPKIFSLLKKANLSGEPLRMSGGRQLVNFLHIDDVVEAYLALIQWIQVAPIARSRGVTFVACGTPTQSLRAVVRDFETVAGQSLDIVWGALPYRSAEVMKPWRGGRRVPGWKPRVSLKAGIRSLLTETSGGPQ